VGNCFKKFFDASPHSWSVFRSSGTRNLSFGSSVNKKIKKVCYIMYRVMVRKVAHCLKFEESLCIITLKLRKPWTLKIFLECSLCLTNHMRDLATTKNEWVSQLQNQVGSQTYKRPQGLTFILSYRNWKCYSFLFENHVHYASKKVWALLDMINFWTSWRNN